MKPSRLLGLLSLVAFTGCDQNQNQILSMREEFQQQMQAKDKAIEEISRKVADVEQQRDKLQEQLLKSSHDSVAPEKIAELVAARLETTTLADMKARIEKIETALSGAAGGRGPAIGGPAAPQAPAEQGPASDPSRKRYKMSF